jgi:hypothetical protein
MGLVCLSYTLLRGFYPEEVNAFNNDYSSSAFIVIFVFVNVTCLSGAYDTFTLTWRVYFSITIESRSIVIY